MKCSECRASKEVRGGVCLAGIIAYRLKNGEMGCACNSQQIEKYIKDFNPGKTHYDEIRAMNIEELAAFMVDKAARSVGEACPPPHHEKCSGKSCYVCWEEYLKQEATHAEE